MSFNLNQSINREAAFPLDSREIFSKESDILSDRGLYPGQKISLVQDNSSIKHYTVEGLKQEISTDPKTGEEVIREYNVYSPLLNAASCGLLTVSTDMPKLYSKAPFFIGDKDAETETYPIAIGTSGNIGISGILTSTGLSITGDADITGTLTVTSVPTSTSQDLEITTTLKDDGIIINSTVKNKNSKENEPPTTALSYINCILNDNTIFSVKSDGINITKPLISSSSIKGKILTITNDSISATMVSIYGRKKDSSNNPEKIFSIISGNNSTLGKVYSHGQHTAYTGIDVYNNIKKKEIFYANTTTTEPTETTEGEIGQIIFGNKKIASIKTDGSPNIFLNPKDIKLEENLYTYVDIGNIKLSGNDAQDGKLVAAKDKTLQDVFNAVFGSPIDKEPSQSLITSYSLTASQTQDVLLGNSDEEVGSNSIDKRTATITFSLDNTGIAEYGYTIVNSKVGGKSTIVYPIVKNSNNSDISILLPEGKTASVVEGKGTLIKYGRLEGSNTDNILYCNFPTNKNEISISISIPAGDDLSGETSTLFGEITATVFLGTPKTSNGTAITGFLTYLGEVSTEVTPISTSFTVNDSTDPYKILGGKFYNYIYSTSSSTHSSTRQMATTERFDRVSTGNTVTVSVETDSSNNYIWIATRNIIDTIKSNNIELEQDTDYTKLENKNFLMVSSGEQISNYYLYKMKKPVVAGTWYYDITF